MAGSTGGRCTPSCGASIPTCCAGPGRSSSDCAHTSGLKPGGRGSPKGSLRCSSTGHGCANSRSDGSDEKSGVKGDFHAPFRGSPGLRCPGRPDYAFDKWLERECSPPRPGEPGGGDPRGDPTTRSTNGWSGSS